MNPIASRLTRLQCAFFIVWALGSLLVSAYFLNAAVNGSRADDAVLVGAAGDIFRSAMDLRAGGTQDKDALQKLGQLPSRLGVSVSIFDDSGRRISGDAAAPSMAESHALVMRTAGQSFDYRFGPSPKPRPGVAPPPDQIFAMRSGLFMSATPMLETAPSSALLPVTSTAVHFPGGFAVLRLQSSLAAAALRGYLLAMTALLVIGAVLAWFVLGRVVRRQLGPMATVEGALLRWTKGDYARIELVDAEQKDQGVVSAYNAAADQVTGALKRQTDAESNMRQFVAEAGHELRTPLTVVMGFLDVLRQGAVREEALAQRILESMSIEGERMRVLIGKLLLLARLDSVATENREIVDIAAIAREVVESFRTLAGQSKLEFSAAGDARVQAAPNEVRELVGNLLDNAIKYAPGSLTRAAVRRINGYVELEVADDGPGMDPALRVRAFDRFSRGDERGNIPGSGLGLAIVKRIADRAGGGVELETAPGRGVRVVVKLPASLTPAS
jgi:signal transduction histidine kinase